MRKISNLNEKFLTNKNKFLQRKLDEWLTVFYRENSNKILTKGASVYLHFLITLCKMATKCRTNDVVFTISPSFPS